MRVSPGSGAVKGRQHRTGERDSRRCRPLRQANTQQTQPRADWLAENFPGGGMTPGLDLRRFNRIRFPHRDIGIFRTILGRLFHRRRGRFGGCSKRKNHDRLDARSTAGVPPLRTYLLPNFEQSPHCFSAWRLHRSLALPARCPRPGLVTIFYQASARLRLRGRKVLLRQRNARVQLWPNRDPPEGALLPTRVSHQG